MVNDKILYKIQWIPYRNSSWISCGVCKSSTQVTVTAELEVHPQSISNELFVLTRLSLCPYPWNISVLISGTSLLYTKSVLRKSQVTYIETILYLNGDTFDSDTQHTVLTNLGSTGAHVKGVYNDNDYIRSLDLYTVPCNRKCVFHFSKTLMCAVKL